MPKRLTLWITANRGKFLKRWEYQTTWPASWEICMQVRKQHLELGATDWFQTGKEVDQGCILSACLCNLYAVYLMWNDPLDEAQARIKISRRNINNLRYTDGTTLMAESKELESLDESERGEWKRWLKTQHSKNEDHGIQSHHFRANRWGKKRKQWQTLQFGAPKSQWTMTAAMKLKDASSLEEKLWRT